MEYSFQLTRLESNTFLSITTGEVARVGTNTDGHLHSVLHWSMACSADLMLQDGETEVVITGAFTAMAQ
jgi:hypothetical protein